jgi:hypothetical protein
MNANELADNWETKFKPHEQHNTREETMYWVNQYRLFGDTAVTMLRQQQAEIEKLSADNKQLCKALLRATKLIPIKE